MDFDYSNLVYILPYAAGILTSIFTFIIWNRQINHKNYSLKNENVRHQREMNFKNKQAELDDDKHRREVESKEKIALLNSITALKLAETKEEDETPTMTRAS